MRIMTKLTALASVAGVSLAATMAFGGPDDDNLVINDELELTLDQVMRSSKNDSGFTTSLLQGYNSGYAVGQGVQNEMQKPR